MVRCPTQTSTPLIGPAEQEQPSSVCAIEKSICEEANEQDAAPKEEEEEEFIEHWPSNDVSWAGIESFDIAHSSNVSSVTL